MGAVSGRAAGAEGVRNKIRVCSSGDPDVCTQRLVARAEVDSDVTDHGEPEYTALVQAFYLHCGESFGSMTPNVKKQLNEAFSKEGSGSSCT